MAFSPSLHLCLPCTPFSFWRERPRLDRIKGLKRCWENGKKAASVLPEIVLKSSFFLHTSSLPCIEEVLQTELCIRIGFLSCVACRSKGCHNSLAQNQDKNRKKNVTILIF